MNSTSSIEGAGQAWPELGRSRLPGGAGPARQAGPTQAATRDAGPLWLAGLLVAIAIIVAATHWPALNAKALWFDDNQYLTDNKLVQHPGWSSARRFLTEVLNPSTVQGYYQPLTMISLMLDVAAGGKPDYVRPFHRTSLALHVANTLLVVMFLYLLFGHPWAAAAAGLLFGLHPLTVEPIPWVGERKTLLASFFAILSLIAYVRYVRSSGNPQSARQGEALTRSTAIRNPQSTGWYAACLAAYLLALLSKPTTTPLPVLMLLLDFWPLGRLNRRAFSEKIPFFALGAVFAVITVVSQARTAEITLPQNYPPMVLPMILCHNIVFYLYKVAFPVNLLPHYLAPNPLSLSSPMVLAGVIGTAVLLAVMLISLRWTRALLTSWLFFFIAIFPTLGVIGFTGVIASDKYAYLPSLGFLILIAWSLAKVWNNRRAAQIGAAVLVVALAAAEIKGTRRTLAQWQDTVGLFERVLAAAPTAGIAHNNLANIFMRQGRTQEALAHFADAVKYSPNFPYGHHNLGYALFLQGKVDEAIGHYRDALRLRPDYPDAQLNLGNALAKQGKPREASAQYQQLLERHPDNAAAHYNLANVLLGMDQLEPAIVHYREALRLQENYPEAQVNLADALNQRGQPAEAEQHLRAALRLQPDWHYAHYILGDVLAAQRRLPEAVAAYREAIRLMPTYAYAHNNLASALAQQEKIDDAIAELREALRLEPSYVKAHFNLATLLLGRERPAEAVEHFEEALRLQPDHARAHSNLGAALERLGRLDEAADHFRHAIRLQPNYVDAHFNLASVLERQRKLNEAMQEYREVLRLDPKHEAAKRALNAATTRPATAPATSRL